MAARRVNVVPHTHWDREWYLPFQRFRARLVELLDELLDRLEQDPSTGHFLLDGQMAVLDDYLAVRPAAAPRLAALARAGRLAMGPWYTLPDEFLVSGETLVRNLQLGQSRAEAYGGAMPVGYLPDMFGHVAQMPQLLRLCGLEHAVVWRGVPAAVDRTGFWWEAPDGSTVRAEYLPTGYGNGAVMPRDPAAFAERVESWVAEVGGLLGPHDAVLWMNGSDHRTPQPFLPAVVAEVNARFPDRLDVHVTSLAAHVTAASRDGLPTWRGELRSSARANLLMGVASNRVDVKVAAAHAERALEQQAEPLAALFLPATEWPTELLDEAWLAMLRNAAHDSVCACSDDEVVAAVLHRYAEARQIAEAVADQALRAFGAQLATTASVVLNPSPFARSGLVEVTVPGHTAIDSSQVLRRHSGETRVFDGSVTTALAVVPEVAGWTDELSGVDVDVDADGVTVVLHADGTTGSVAPNRSAVTARLAALAPGTRVRAVLRRPPTHTALVHVHDLPGYGWAPVPERAGDVEPVIVLGDRVANGKVTVEIDRQSGTFALDGVAGFGRLVDDGDAGDTYNWCPPAHDTVVDGPETVEVTVLEHGPLRVRVRIASTYRWPVRVDDATGRRVGEAVVPVATEVTVLAGEPFVRVSHTIDNRAEDHRLRVWFPLPVPAATSRAECAFAVVERGIEAEGGPTETGLPTFPSRRFVRAGGLTVVHEGLSEYELVDVRDGAARSLAITLLRATRYLSRGPMATRPLPAGPVVELRGSQMPGRHTVRYAVSTAPVDPYRLVDEAFLPLRVVPGAGTGPLAPHGQALRVEGDAVVSSLGRRAGVLELRAFNPSSGLAALSVPGRSGHVVDFTGRVLGTFDGALTLDPHAIVTVALA